MNRRHPQAGAVHSRKQSAHRRVFTLVIPGLVLCGLTLLLWIRLRSPKEPTVPVRIVALDCDLTMADGACYPRPHFKKHRLLITGAPSGAPSLTLYGRTTVQAEELIIDHQQRDYFLFLAPLPREDSVFAVTVQGNGEARSTQLRTFVPKIPAWLSELWEARYPKLESSVTDEKEKNQKEEESAQDKCDGPKNERAKLDANAHQLESLSALARSLYLSLLARNMYNQCPDPGSPRSAELTNEEIIKAFRAAIQAAESAGVLSERNQNVLWLAEFLCKKAGRLDEAEALIRKFEEELKADPSGSSYYYRQIALHQGLRNQLNDALESLVKALLAAQRLEDRNAAFDVALQAAEFFVERGQVATALKWAIQQWQSLGPQASKYQVPGGEGCRRTELFKIQLRIRRVAAEAEPERALPKDLEPERLREGFFSGPSECRSESWRTEFWLDWARLHLNSEAEVRRALEELPKETHALHKEPTVQKSRHYLEGMLALREGNLALAESHFTSLQGLSTGVADVATWQAAVGLAQVAEARRTEEGDAEARRHYQMSETWVDLNCLSVPLLLGQGSYLSQFERGTSLYLLHLLRKKDLPAAASLIRRALVRGRRLLSLLNGLDSNSEKRTALIQRLREFRIQLEPRTQQRVEAAASQEQLRQTEVFESHLEKVRDLQRFLGRLAPEAALLLAEPGSPRTGEVMIMCYPLPKDWLCLAVDSAGVAATEVVDADWEPAAANPVTSPQAQRLSRKLLMPFSDKIAKAQRVSFLTYGKMRRVDLQMLPFELQNLPGPTPLQFQREVMFSSDVPAYRTAGASRMDDFHLNMNRNAYLFFLQEGSIANAVTASITPIKQAMRTTGHTIRSNEWTVWMRLRRQLAQWGRSPAPFEYIPYDQFAAELSRADLLHVISHVREPAGDKDPRAQGKPERYIDLGDFHPYYLSDVLALPKVPEIVTLFACGSAKSEEEWGNVEGLGLAQAFVWRGSRWVLGTERVVETKLGARISTSFYEELAKSGEPFQSLRYALEHSGVSMADAQQTPDKDLGAFRLYAQ